MGLTYLKNEESKYTVWRYNGAGAGANGVFNMLNLGLARIKVDSIWQQPWQTEIFPSWNSGAGSHGGGRDITT
jgi:hypothetical protein